MNENASPAELLSLKPKAERMAFINSLSETDRKALLTSWEHFNARKNQLPPPGDWDIWMMMAGRGFGKTRSGSEWVRHQVETCFETEGEPIRIALINETQKDLKQVMLEGDSGILAVCGDLIEKYIKKPTEVYFKNGSVALGYNGTEPEQLRGPQFHRAWLDELAKYRYARETWDQLQFGLRLGSKPRSLITTTPRPIELIRAIHAGEEGKVEVTLGNTKDNESNLAKSFIEKIYNKYEGTRLGRQELAGEILGDIQGALWRLSVIDLYRHRITFDEHGYRKNTLPDMHRILVGVDPAISSNPNSDEHGIVVAGMSDGEGYILEDGSMQGSPLEWAQKAVSLHDKWNADGVVVEVNQGGEMCASTLRTVRPNLNVIMVHASRGKHIRAEPVSSLYEQGRIHHVGCFPELEEQMTHMTNMGYVGQKSPDRCDALVWVLTELFPSLVENAIVNVPEFKRRTVA